MKSKPNAKDGPNQVNHAGHRKSVRESYLAHGLLGEPDHCVLELLLFYGIPYRDTNPIAHALIDAFGSFSAVLEATPEQLQRIKGMTANAAVLLNLILPVFRRYEEDARRRPRLETSTQVADYMRSRYRGVTVETLYALCFDETATLLSVRKVVEGDACSMPMDFRALAAAALETGATHVTLVHNHPGGIAAPSMEDARSTRSARTLLKALKINLDDHIIVAGEQFFSMANSARFASIFLEGDGALLT
ncbi:MAG: hypothetical protein IJL52_00700 [Clostridia bacterium]|nr:hypothetical protein [Clostridia bacterium]